MKMPMRAGVLLSLLLVAGCRRPPANSPEGTYRAFVAALQKADTRRAYAMLSPATREKISARSKAIAEASQGLVRDEPEALLFQGSRPAAPGEITQISADATTAVLKVGDRQVKLVQDSGKWVIDLSDTLERRDVP